jgi:hypothetical protein
MPNRLLAGIIIASFSRLAAFGQTEKVTLLQTETVSQTQPAPDCSGLTGFSAGFCSAQREAAQTAVPYTYYTFKNEQTAYLLSCRPGGLLQGLRRCPVLVAGQQYILSIEGKQVVLRDSPGTKGFRLDLVVSHSNNHEDEDISATRKTSETPGPEIPPKTTSPEVDQSQTDEIALYTGSGKPVAYIADDDESTIYLWSGKPVAYLRSEDIYGFNGKHLGWLVGGLIYDHDGAIVGSTQAHLRGVPQVSPIKSLKEIKPMKGIAEISPVKPVFRLSWSEDETLRMFFLRGAD